MMGGARAHYDGIKAFSETDSFEDVIRDDAGQITPQKGDGWEVISVVRRFRSLPEKFNALAGFAHGGGRGVWEEHIDLPWG